MLLKLERNGRKWKNKKRVEEVLDVYHGDNFREKLPRGFCHCAFKKIIKERLKIGEALIIDLQIIKTLLNESKRDQYG